VLHGEKVMLRPLEEADLPRLVEILRHPEVREWWGDYDEARLREDYLVEGCDQAGFAILAGDELAGIVSYWEENEPDYRHAGMDIAVAADRHAEGLGTDALRTLGRHLLDVRGHHRLVIDPATANERAIRAYERVGFRPVGVMRRAEQSPDGVWRDALLMDLLADELPR
jgi:aminoglycoside 6'-N-acetyltransferase